MKKSVMSGMILFPAFLLLLATMFGDPDVVDFYTAEDGIIENLSASLYFVGFIFCFYRVFIVKQKPVSMLVVWMVLCFFLLGEETSYFQRVFNFETPEYIQSDQNEFNLHNLTSLQMVKISDKEYPILCPQNLFRAGFLTYFILLPFGWGLRYFNRLKEIHLYDLPSRFFAINVVALLGMTALFTVSSESHRVRSAIGEVHELFYAAIILVYVVRYLSKAAAAGNTRSEALAGSETLALETLHVEGVLEKCGK